MTAISDIGAGHDQAVVADKLCKLLLDIAGRDTNRLPSVIRHVQTLDAALPHMNPEHQATARERIDRLQTKWGCLLPTTQKQPEIASIPPETRIVRWLSQRRHPERLLRIMHLSARTVLAGETSLSIILDRGYEFEDDGIVSYVGYDSFKEWLLVTQVACRETKGVYRPGILCRWWAEEMAPSKDRQSGYAACLKQLQQHREARWVTRKAN